MEWEMELYQGDSLKGEDEEKFEEEFEEVVEYKVVPRPTNLLEKLTQTPLEVGDLIGENIQKLEKLLQNKDKEPINNDLRFEIEGLAITLTAYKLKKILGEKYLQSNRSADYFIEVRYLSNLLKGINKTLENKRKTPTEISNILYNVVTDLIRNYNVVNHKDKQKLDPIKRIYNVLTKKFFIKYDPEKFTESIIDIGKAFDNIKGGNIRKKIEEDLSRYKKMPYESLKQLETIQVAKALAHEEENIRYKLANINR